MQKFLLIQTAFLGDVILATPVISELKRVYPLAQIDVLVRKGNETLLENNPNIHKTFTFNKNQGKWKEIVRLIKTFRTNKYDEVINLHRFGSSGLITVLSKAKRKTGFKKNPFSFLYSLKIPHKIGDGTHEVTRNLSCIAHHSKAEIIKPTLFPSENDFLFINEFVKEKYYVFAPASVWFTKQLPEKKWIELAKIYAEKGKVYFIGAPSDVEFCERIVSTVHHTNCINLAGKFTLLQSSALMKNAERVFVNDSGPMHMASAMNAKTTAFFCATVPSFGFGPLSDDSEIRETKDTLNCRPCGLHGGKSCPEKHFKCGEIDLI